MQKVHFDGSLEDFENIFLLEPLLPEEEQKVFWVHNPEFLFWADKPKSNESTRVLDLLTNLRSQGLEVVITCVAASERVITQLRRKFKHITTLGLSSSSRETFWFEFLRPLSQKDVDFHLSQIAERNNVDIEFKAKKELKERFGRDITMIQNEIEKLSLVYSKIRTNEIEFSGDINKWPSDTTLFKRCFEVVSNFELFFSTTQMLLKKGVSEVTLLAQINYVFRLLIKVFWLWKDEFSVKEIGETLELKALKICSPTARTQKGISESCTYRYTNVEEAIKFLEQTPLKAVTTTLELAAECDEYFKTGVISSSLAFDFFLLKLRQELRGLQW